MACGCKDKGASVPTARSAEEAAAIEEKRQERMRAQEERRERYAATRAARTGSRR
jgi:hypothetical protein